MANETLLRLRSNVFSSMEMAAPSPGVTAGVIVALASGCVGLFQETKATGGLAAFIYKAEKCVVNKGSGAILAGAKVYYNSSDNKVYGASATGRRYCGHCTVAAGSSDTTVEIDLDGTLGITAQVS